MDQPRPIPLGSCLSLDGYPLTLVWSGNQAFFSPILIEMYSIKLLTWTPRQEDYDARGYNPMTQCSLVNISFSYFPALLVAALSLAVIALLSVVAPFVYR